MMMKKAAQQGFTLSELLISLAILGLIATFSIPKVLNAVGANSTRAIAKEFAGTLSESYDAYKANNNGSTATTITGQLLINYINFVSAVTSGTATMTGITCSGTSPCYTMANGSAFQVTLADDFGPYTAQVADSTGVIVFLLDPDGAGANTPVTFAIGYDGRLMDGSTLATATTPFTFYDQTNNNSVAGLTPAANPTWFAWT